MQNNQQPATILAEQALEIVVRNVPLDSDSMKALRLTCKRTKAAADARVKKFTLSEFQEPEAVQRSGLLHNITQLEMSFNILPSEDGDESQHALNSARALGLLNLAVDVCSKSLEVLEVRIEASPQTLLACGSILGESNWESLQELIMLPNCAMPGFLSGILGARPGTLPALKELWCQGPSAADIEAVCSSGFLGNLTTLAIKWSEDAYETNTAPEMIAAMPTLLENATNLEGLALSSSTFEFFDSEQLISLKTFDLTALNPDDDVIAPVLARPLTTLESFSIDHSSLTGPALIRVFEAEDTLPALKRLSINFHLDVDAVNALSCLRRPHLEEFCMYHCANGHVLISKLAQLMKANPSVAPHLQGLKITCRYDDDDDLDPLGSTIKSLSEFLLCPCMAGLEELWIMEADLEDRGNDLLFDIVNYCPKLKILNLRFNYFSRKAVALLLGLGMMGAWPQLEKLCGLLNKSVLDDEDPNDLNAEHPYMPKLDVQQTLRRVWPGLECS